MELLPPERNNRENAQAVTDFAIPALRRLRNRTLEKEFASQAGVLRAWNEVLVLLRDEKRNQEEYEAALARSQHLPALRAAAKLKVATEVRQIRDQYRKVGEDEEDRKLERSLRRTRLEADLIRAQRELEELKNPPPKPAPQPQESRGSRRVAAIRRMREERDEMIAILLAGRTEEEVEEADRELIDEIRLTAEHQIKSFLEEDRD